MSTLQVLWDEAQEALDTLEQWEEDATNTDPAEMPDFDSMIENDWAGAVDLTAEDIAYLERLLEAPRYEYVRHDPPVPTVPLTPSAMSCLRSMR